MKILLEELQHQTDALNAIVDNFPKVQNAFFKNENPYANKLIDGAYEEKSNIDIKMETGTGKTYVYTRLMYELHKQHGMFKFVIVVPSPAIKVGTQNFIESEYAKRHFSQFYGNTKIELSVINAGDFRMRGGRRNFPAQLLNFIEGSSQNSHSINVLIINAGMLRSKNMTREDYDQTFLGGITSPMEAIKETNPILIMDEPHRFPRNKANYRHATSMDPQMIFRFGATFPEIIKGSGKNAVVIKDYYRGYPQFDLNAIESFNKGLVKGIDIYYPQITKEQSKNIYTVDTIKNKELILKQKGKTWKLNIGDPLSKVDSDFEGEITYEGSTSRELSNGLELSKGMKLVPGTFRTSYQELIIKDAIDKHFEIEQKNFMRDNNRDFNKPKIKTLSLFFIDDIRSYRNEGWLLERFEKILKEKLKKLIDIYEFKRLPREKEYLEFLLATQNSLHDEVQNVHAGYFGEDRGSGDEAIQDEVDDILKNKTKLMSFRDEQEKWITRRFLFSKWTLREGWDNPNVFVIAKLRTSGSETSKIQEVGRGLRLPVAENGFRIKQTEIESRLAFLIGYDEREFAKKLVGEINSDVKINLSIEKLTDDMINVIVNHRTKNDTDFTDEKLLSNLDGLGIINRRNDFKKNVEIDGITQSGFEWLEELYPEIKETKLLPGKIVDTATEQKKTTVKLNKENWDKVKSIWDKFSRGYMIQFKRMPHSIETIVYDVFGDVSLFERETPTMIHHTLKNQGNVMAVEESEAFYDDSQYREGIPYGQFLKLLHGGTNIPVKLIHNAFLTTFRDKLNGDSTYLSESTLSNLVSTFKKRFEETYSQMYEYKQLDFSASTSIYDVESSEFKKEIHSGLVGVHQQNNATIDERYLYERPPLFYDSFDPEKTLLEFNYSSKVTVFGKLPKNSIKVPKYTGGSTTPDLIYVIETEESKNVYLLVETKAEDMRLSDQKVIEIHKRFFNQLENYNIEYTEAVKPEDVHRKIQQIIEGEKNNDN